MVFTNDLLHAAKIVHLRAHLLHAYLLATFIWICHQNNTFINEQVISYDDVLTPITF